MTGWNWTGEVFDWIARGELDVGTIVPVVRLHTAISE